MASRNRSDTPQNLAYQHLLPQDPRQVMPSYATDDPDVREHKQAHHTFLMLQRLETECRMLRLHNQRLQHHCWEQDRRMATLHAVHTVNPTLIDHLVYLSDMLACALKGQVDSTKDPEVSSKSNKRYRDIKLPEEKTSLTRSQQVHRRLSRLESVVCEMKKQKLKLFDVDRLSALIVDLRRRTT